MPNRFRQLFYRGAFFLLCVAPTVYTLGLIVESRVSSVAASIESASQVPAAAQELSWRLGARVTLGGIEYLPEKVTRLSQVKLFDQETDVLLAEADSVELYFAEGGRLVIEPRGLSLRSAELPRLGDLLQQRVLRELPAGTPVVVQCPTVHLLGEREETLADVELTLDVQPSGRRARIAFHPAWDARGEPLKLEIVRRTDAPKPFTSIAFHTGEKSLAASWFAPVMPSLAELGDACQVRGEFGLSDESLEWESTFHGRLTGIELDRLVVRRLRPYPLGTAQLHVNHARWRGGRLAEAEGWLKAGPAPMSLGLLKEAADVLALPSLNAPASDNSLRGGSAAEQGLVYCAFTLDGSGLALLGHQGAVLNDGAMALLGQPTNKLPWTVESVALCRDLGLPPLAVMPLPHQGGRPALRMQPVEP